MKRKEGEKKSKRGYSGLIFKCSTSIRQKRPLGQAANLKHTRCWRWHVIKIEAARMVWLADGALPFLEAHNTHQYEEEEEEGTWN